jgi:choline-phosphate cytidylyltransferase
MRRTPGISTSSLLERIVKSYRKRDFDKKLEKMRLAELKAQGSDYEDKGGSDEVSSGGKPSR